VWRTRDLTAAPGAGTATSLGEILRRARPWSRIHLRPGLYDEALTLDHSVTLIGGPGVVLQGGDSGCLVVRGGTVTLRGLAMRGGTGAGRAAIDLQDGELRMENCDVTSFGPACEHAHGGRSCAALRDCSLRGVIGAGLLVQDGASGELIRSLCSACERSGVSVEGEGSRVEVRECRLLDCQRNGIRVVEGARGRAADTQISQNRYANVKVDGASRLTLERCRIEEGQASGVQAQGDSQVSLIDCRVLHNGLGSGRSAEGDPIRRVGIEAENGAVVRVKGGLIAQNRFPGVWAGRNPDWLGKAARAELDDCPLAANGGAAVEIDEGGAVMARRCGLYGNARAVLVHPRGSGALDGCDLEGKLVSAPGGQLTATASGTVAGLRQKLLPAAPPGAAGSRSPHGPNGSGAVDGAAGH
jgi:Right handed beta helix region